MKDNNETNREEQYNECPASAVELLADIETFRVLGQPKEALNRIDLYVKSQITKLQDENSTLAAHQCDKPYGDDYGNKRCAYQDRILELEEALKKVCNKYNNQTEGKSNVHWESVAYIMKDEAEQALNKK